MESENTFRNHVTLDYSINTTVSGVYFHDANDYGGGGYGYGVGIWDSSNNRVENSIFKHLRHGVTIVDGSWFNVIGYNYFREQYSYAEVDLPFQQNNLVPQEIVQKWSDIAIHGESYNTWQSEDDPSVAIDSLRTPYYNLIEGNNLEYLCVDATHQHNGTHNTFINNRVTEQIHVMGYDGFPDGLPHAVIYSGLFITAISTLYGNSLPVLQFNLSEGWDEAFFGWELGFDIGLYMSYQLFNILSYFCCKDCLSFRIADLTTQLNHNSSNHTHRFQNQPKQIFINNYARECNWWKSVIQDYPVRMHSETASSKNNTRKHHATWWGGTQKKTIHRNAAFDDLQTCYITGEGPGFWPDVIDWPYNYRKDGNPAQQRFHLNGKKTVGEDDNTNYLVEQTISADTLIVQDYTVEPGVLLKISPGVTISVRNGRKILVHGSMIAEGTEADPITFTCSDSLGTWRGIEVKQKNDNPLPSIELNYCNLSRANKRAVLLDTYATADINSCKFFHNYDHGALSSRDGVLRLSNSHFLDNSIYSNSPKFGSALYIENSDAHISNTLFMENESARSSTGTIHINSPDSDEERTIEFHNSYFSDNTFTGSASNVNMGLAIYSEDYEGDLHIYNCSFIDQPQEIFSDLTNDLHISNSLFWSNDAIQHFIKSDQTNSAHSFVLSKSFIPEYTQSPNMNNYTVLDIVYVGNAMLQLDSVSNLYSHGVFSPW